MTCIRQESANEPYRNTMKDILLLNTVSKKDEKPHTSTLDDTAIILHEKSSILQHHKPQYLPLLVLQMKFSNFDFKMIPLVTELTTITCIPNNWEYM